MKNCTDCKYAEWHRTAVGKLHPDGDGYCEYPFSLPKLPAAMYWVTLPRPSGGSINRRRDLKDHCVYFVRK